MASAMSSNECSSADVISKECSICCEKYNMSTIARVVCEYGDCKYEACKGCVRTYLLNTDADPHCMNCKKAWSQKFLVENLNKSYMTKEYKAHKKQFLLEREISKLPQTMDAAENYSLINAEEIKCKEIYHEMNRARKLLLYIQIKYNNSRNLINTYKRNLNIKVDVVRNEFIMACPNNDCRGYLSTQYKCKLCNLHTCSKCHEIIGNSKDEEHTCKEENIQTAEMIKKETKPCPTCGTRISKISGCDQMWCPSCHKAFSWNTGKIDNGIIHNPHFYEYQRKTNGGVAPRNQGDVQCGGLCSWYDLNSRILNKIVSTNHKNYSEFECMELRKTITELHRCIGHILEGNLQSTRNKITQLSDTEKIRVDYILKIISKDEMATKIYRNNTLRQKYMEYIHIYELFTVVGIEFYNGLIASTMYKNEFIDHVVEKLKEFHVLRQYCNEQFVIISNTYGQSVPQIYEKFNIENKKFSTKKIVRKGKGKAKADTDDDDMSDTTSVAGSSVADSSLADTHFMSEIDDEMPSENIIIE
jgi:hypothetical protein